jgi:hypothetical protein
VTRTIQTFLASLLVLAPIACSGEEQKAIVPSGSRIFVEAAEGFDTYLDAALRKKHVPLVVVADKEKADYALEGVSDHTKAGWAKVVFLGQIHSDEQAGIRLVNLKTSEVVFAYAVNKKNSLHGRQTAAEACAKHLKDIVSKN